MIALACDKNGVAVSAEDKTRLAHELIAKAAAYDVAPERIHIDPLVLALSAVNDSALHFFEAIKSIKKACPSVNITAALSNVSYGMPARKNVNCNFLALAIQAGINSVICNPLDKEMVGTIYATEAILGRDRLCRRYNQAYRAGKFGTKK